VTCTAQAAKVAPFAAGNGADVRKIAAGDFSNKLQHVQRRIDLRRPAEQAAFEVRG